MIPPLADPTIYLLKIPLISSPACIRTNESFDGHSFLPLGPDSVKRLKLTVFGIIIVMIYFPVQSFLGFKIAGIGMLTSRSSGTSAGSCMINCMTSSQLIKVSLCVISKAPSNES